MGWKSIDIMCPDCNHKWDTIVSSEEVDLNFLCGECGMENARKCISTPMIMTAALPDGTKRFSDMKEAAKLKTVKSQTNDADTRKNISKEIRKLGVKEYKQ